MAVFTLIVSAASAQSFSDTTIGYRFGDYFREPGVADDRHPRGVNIDKNILNIGHADAWQYGSNFFNLDLLKSNARDPANNSSQGALEAYFVYRGDLSPNQIFKTNMFTFGPVRDITLQAGFDINTKNTRFASQKNLIVIGPNIHFNTSGFFNLAVLLGKEWNNNGITNRSVNFDPQVIFSAVFSYPLDFQKFAPLRVDGFANFNSPKGTDGFGAKTQWEILSQTRLVLDLGQVVLNKPRLLATVLVLASAGCATQGTPPSTPNGDVTQRLDRSAPDSVPGARPAARYRDKAVGTDPSAPRVRDSQQKVQVPILTQ